MIISHKYRYVFVQLPHTGCSAIEKILREDYEGEPIHRKHTTYHRFLKSASKQEKSYFTFSGIRNPITEVISIYYKYKTNHEGYDNPRWFIENGGFVTPRMRKRFSFVQNSKNDFEQYFLKYHRFPYDNWSRLNHKKFDFVIRFENLNDDFSEVLDRIGIRETKQLPVYNVTRKKKKSATTLFHDRLRRRTEWVFGPFLQDWGYHSPITNEPPNVPLSSRMLYESIGMIRAFYWKLR